MRRHGWYSARMPKQQLFVSVWPVVLNPGYRLGSSGEFVKFNTEYIPSEILL